MTTSPTSTKALLKYAHLQVAAEAMFDKNDSAKGIYAGKWRNSKQPGFPVRVFTMAARQIALGLKARMTRDFGISVQAFVHLYFVPLSENHDLTS